MPFNSNRVNKQRMRVSFLGGILVIAVGLVSTSMFGSAQALPNSPFTTFDTRNEGFTQSVYGVGGGFFSGVAFAPNGDPLVNQVCGPGDDTMVRFDHSATYVSHGTVLHNGTEGIKTAGCGMTSSPDGNIYVNTGSGVRKFTPEGVELSIAGSLGGVGAPGNALGIAVQQGTNLVFYVNSGNNIEVLNAGTGTSSTFNNTGGFIDAIVFGPAGQHLYFAQRSGGFRLGDLNTITNSVSYTALPDEPDGMRFHIPTNSVITDTTNGKLLQIFIGNGTVDTIASGGFRGDLSQVGPDGCMYLTQQGTRYDNGDVTGEQSLVRLCGGGFTIPNPPPPTTTVGGEIIPMSMTSLFVAGAAANALWIAPVVGGAVVASIVGIVKSRKNSRE